MVCTVLAGHNKWDHCTHLTWNLGHRMKWDHYKHPLPYHFVLCWGDLFASDHVCGHQYALLKGQCVYGLYSFGGAEQVRPLHTPYLKSGSQDEVRPLQAPLTISLCALLGWSLCIRSCLWVSICSPKGSVCLWFVPFCRDRTIETIARILLETRSLAEVRPLHASLVISLCALLGWFILIRSCLWVSICAPKGSVCLWFVQFWRGWSENTAHTLLEIWVTGWSETTTTTPYHITLCFVGSDLFTLDYICGYQYALIKGQFVYGLYSVAWTEQVRPLQASHLKNGSLTEVRPLQASPIISPCVCWVMFSH